MSKQSDTPETDANLYGWAVEAEFARKLERERDIARANLAIAREMLAKRAAQVAELQVALEIKNERIEL